MGIEPTSRVRRLTGFEDPLVHKYAQTRVSHCTHLIAKNQGLASTPTPQPDPLIDPFI
jgi:hypothetical protein